jgi:SAM-dependent methyltransferase
VIERRYGQDADEPDRNGDGDAPPRRALQRRWVPVLLRLGDMLPPGSALLEIGCGSGYGPRLIQECFAAHVDTIDLDAAMVERARDRLARCGDRVRPAVADAGDPREAFPGEAGYDAVFDFAILHRIQDWRAAIGEITQMLRPGGRFYFDEVTAESVATRSYRVLFDRPEVDRFTGRRQFVDEFGRHGLRTGDRWFTRIRGHYLLGVVDRMPAGGPGPQ